MKTNTLLAIVALLVTSLSLAENCADCHAEEAKLWLSSDHAKAMATPSQTSILGDFSDVEVSHHSQQARFYSKDGDYLIDFTEQGVMTTYTVAFAFGHSPLQEYLIETSDGRYQVFPFAYDTRDRELGGQKWYPIYADEDIEPNDRLHWKQPLQNWNGMCADCHSDGLKRNYLPSKNKFDTTYDNINVGCASCHTQGPTHGSLESGKPKPIAKQTLATPQWSRAPGDKVASLKGTVNKLTVIDTCYSCHSLRSPLTDGIDVASKFLDQFSPNLLTPPLYHADGQIRDEVYVYGSFLQSKMYRAGVTCLNCHDPHSQKIKIEGNGLCLQCHEPKSYQTIAHTNHPLSSTGGQCVSCHMPETTYMGVDARRDHSFSIPRPHLSEAFNTPNACVKCHEDKSNNWASEATKKMWGRHNAPSRADHAYMQLQHQGHLEPQAHLALAQDLSLSPIKRASVISLLPQSINQLSASQAKPFITSDEPLVRLAIAKVGYLLPPHERLKEFSKLATDPLKAVRVASADNLVDIQSEIAGLDKATNELLLSHEISTWRGEANLNSSLTHAKLGNTYQSIEALKHAITIDPYFDASYINLADHYRQQRLLSKELETLTKGIAAIPRSASLHHAMGLLKIRNQDKPSSIAYFKKAMSLDPTNVQHVYLYVLALDAVGSTDLAIEALRDTIEQYRYNPQLVQLGLNFSMKTQSFSNYQFFKGLSVGESN